MASEYSSFFRPLTLMEKWQAIERIWVILRLLISSLVIRHRFFLENSKGRVISCCSASITSQWTAACCLTNSSASWSDGGCVCSLRCHSREERAYLLGMQEFLHGEDSFSVLVSQASHFLRDVLWVGLDPRGLTMLKLFSFAKNWTCGVA